MNIPVVKRCPRCKNEFLCHHENIALCECSKIKLTAAEREKISRLFSGCLCIKCLQELKTEIQKSY